jgi:hypothetical protein
MMVQVLILKSLATLSSRYSKGAVAWMEKATAKSYEKHGQLKIIYEPEIVAPDFFIKRDENQTPIKPVKVTRKRKK